MISKASNDNRELIGLFVKSFKLSYYNEYKSYLRPDEDVDTSKISPVVNLSTLFHL